MLMAVTFLLCRMPNIWYCEMETDKLSWIEWKTKTKNKKQKNKKTLFHSIDLRNNIKLIHKYAIFALKTQSKWLTEPRRYKQK